MSRTFEEVAGRELDGLYRGALFLTAGAVGEAETLLSAALTRAFRRRTGLAQESATAELLERCLIEVHLDRAPELHDVPPAPTGRQDVTDRSVFDSLRSEEVFQVAETVPPWPRAALWLVVLRRRSYARAASALGIGRPELMELLRYRDVLVAGLMRPSPRRASGGA